MSDKRIARNTGIKNLDKKIKTTSAALTTARDAGVKWARELDRLNEELTVAEVQAFEMEDVKRGAELQNEIAGLQAEIQRTESKFRGAQGAEVAPRSALATLLTERVRLAAQVAKTQVKTQVRKIKKLQEKTYLKALELAYCTAELRKAAGEAEQLARDYKISSTVVRWKNVSYPVTQWLEHLFSVYSKFKIDTSGTTFERRTAPMAHLLDSSLGLKTAKMAEAANSVGSSRTPDSKDDLAVVEGIRKEALVLARENRAAARNPNPKADSPKADSPKDDTQPKAVPVKLEKVMLQPTDDYIPASFGEATDDDLTIAAGTEEEAYAAARANRGNDG